MSKVPSVLVVPVENLWTVREVAEFLRVGRHSVYEMAKRGEMPSLRVGARVRFVPEEVRAWLDRQRAPRPSVASIEPVSP